MGTLFLFLLRPRWWWWWWWGINADFLLKPVLPGSSCEVQGFLDRPRPSGGGNHCSFSMGRLQNRAPPELAFQQPIQGSSVAQRPEPVTRSLA